LAHLLADALAVLGQVAGQTAQIKKCFVNGIHLHAGRELPQDRHHATAHVGIEGVVRGERHDAMLASQRAALIPGLSHLDAQGLGFSRTGHSAAIIVGEHHHGHALQPRGEQPLAGDVEIIAVHQGNDWPGVHRL